MPGREEVPMNEGGRTGPVSLVTSRFWKFSISVSRFSRSLTRPRLPMAHGEKKIQIYYGPITLKIHLWVEQITSQPLQISSLSPSVPVNTDPQIDRHKFVSRSHHLYVSIIVSSLSTKLVRTYVSVCYVSPQSEEDTREERDFRSLCTWTLFRSRTATSVVTILQEANCFHIDAELLSRAFPQTSQRNTCYHQT